MVFKKKNIKLKKTIVSTFFVFILNIIFSHNLLASFLLFEKQLFNKYSKRHYSKRYLRSNKMEKQKVINKNIAKDLIKDQFPQWKDLTVTPVRNSGWDNRTFHLGKEMLLRFPSARGYAAQVEKEQKWLPILAPKLPLAIPTPLGHGYPGYGYPWNWSVYNWIPGETAARNKSADRNKLALRLSNFLSILYDLDTADGPLPGDHNYQRGSHVKFYEKEALKSIELLESKIETKILRDIWYSGAETEWTSPPVWVHGDVSPGNLLTDKDGNLSAVIDFGLLSVGDPACDLVIAWSYLDDESRRIFRERLDLDKNTWRRGRAWALWKASIIASGISKSNPVESQFSHRVLMEIMEDFRRSP